ncbi:dicarboxylate/amino acid:cation symporter [Niabella drilacis]|uniref:Na+/H+-dicarboxylate symporter n=1 Tax=Niabella drilacis (strain DSM 25811 / CCM 8410 / CCUG 62505 / LMG 26954 / E90) TaxID=1285928 RepID=A0A1G6RYB9_NIADE|nr:dicarboxylate/amino acid:cation symporter [Niabella drilacis]SDD09672.1 Na+/H+-dicarboxylate symporter [Niabella drilacis]
MAKFSGKQLWRSYSGIILLLAGMVAGGITGVFFPKIVPVLKPVGDIFLNLLFVTVVPLVFFAIAVSVAAIEQKNRLGRILAAMAITFLAFVLLAAVFTILMAWLFPPAIPMADQGAAAMVPEGDHRNWGERLVAFFTVGEFYQLLSRQNMLALLVFALLLGTAVRRSGPKAKPFLDWLVAGNEVMKNLLLLIMKGAPVGLGAYIAYQAADLGPQLFGFYAKPMALYYGTGILYFFIFFTLYAFVANGRKGIRLFWKNNMVPSLTAVSTCSSLATMPANLVAADRIGIPASVANVVIPLGTTLHKNGSSISAIVKIYVVFQMLGWNFFDPQHLILALGITVLCSMVEGGIPNGGYIGELLMIAAYRLPAETVPAVMIIGTLVDPLATVLNATGNTVAAMVVTRLTGAKFQVKAGLEV